MKHKRVLFGLLAAVAAMMFLFCGDSVVTTGNGNETPGTTPGTEGGGPTVNENVYILAKTNKGISVTNPQKLSKTAATASDINAALEIIRKDASGKTQIVIQFGKDDKDTLDYGTNSATIKGSWTVSYINITGALKGGSATNATLIIGSISPTVIVDAVLINTQNVRRQLDKPSGSYGVNYNPDKVNPDNVTEGGVIPAPTPPEPPQISDWLVTRLTKDSAKVEFKVSQNVKTWIYVVASWSTPTVKTFKEWGTPYNNGAVGNAVSATVSVDDKKSEFIHVLVETPNGAFHNFSSQDVPSLPSGVPGIEVTNVDRFKDGTVNVSAFLSGYFIVAPLTYYLLVDVGTTELPSVADFLADPNKELFNLGSDISFNLDIKLSKKILFVGVNPVDVDDTTKVTEYSLQGDDVGPVLSFAGTTVDRDVTGVGVSFDVTSDENFVKLYYTSTAPTSPAALAANPNAGVWPDPQDPSIGLGVETATLSISGLPTDDGTKIYIVAEDSVGNISSALLTVAVADIDLAPPTATASFARVAKSTTEAVFTLTSHKNATLYYLVADGSGTAPDSLFEDENDDLLTGVVKVSVAAGVPYGPELPLTVTAVAGHVVYYQLKNTIPVAANGAVSATDALSAYDDVAPVVTPALITRTADVISFSISAAGEAGSTFYYTLRTSTPPNDSTDWIDILTNENDVDYVTGTLNSSGTFTVSNLSLSGASGALRSIYIAVADTNDNLGLATLIAVPTPTGTSPSASYVDDQSSPITDKTDANDIDHIKFAITTTATKLWYTVSTTNTPVPGLNALAKSVEIESNVAEIPKSNVSDMGEDVYIFYALESGEAPAAVLKSDVVATPVTLEALTD